MSTGKGMAFQVEGKAQVEAWRYDSSVNSGQGQGQGQLQPGHIRGRVEKAGGTRSWRTWKQVKSEGHWDGGGGSWRFTQVSGAQRPGASFVPCPPLCGATSSSHMDVSAPFHPEMPH